MILLFILADLCLFYSWYDFYAQILKDYESWQIGDFHSPEASDITALDAALMLGHVAVLSLSVLEESLNKDGFNNQAVGGIQTNHSFFSL